VAGVRAGVCWSQCVGGKLDTVNNVCYTYHSLPKTREDAAASCRIDGSQFVSIEVSCCA